jgi:adenylate cyclase
MIFLLSYWIIAAIFYVFLEMAIEGYTASAYDIYKLNYKYNFARVLIIAVFFVLVGGSVLASFEVLYFSKFFRKIPFGKVLIFKSLFYFVSIFILTSFATYTSLIFILGKSPLHLDVFERYLLFLKSPKIWALIAYWSFVIISSLFVLEISEKLGQGILVNYLLGKYHSPKEENRIFMFLDLISSTAYAEKLGHKKYSMFIQDCFSDLTDVVINCCAQIYQYVGDEVVLTWESKKGIKNNNCIKAFFEFEDTLKNKEEYYKKKYGFIPEFKAGLNFGLVTVAEVGEMKKELAYHGDAINIAARIRSNSNAFKKKILISADLLSVLHEIDDDYVVESVGICNLKGKENMVAIFSVDKKNKINIRSQYE